MLPDGTCRTFPGERFDLLVARRFLHGKAVQMDECERGVKLLYANQCAAHPWPLLGLDRSVGPDIPDLDRVNFWMPGPDAPALQFFWDMEINGAGVTGIDRDRHRLVRFDFRGGVAEVPLAGDPDIHSQTAGQSGNILLTGDGETVLVLDEALDIGGSVRLERTPGPRSRIRTVDGGFALFRRNRRKVVFLDRRFRYRATVTLGCADKTYDAFGYGDGLLFMDRKAENPGLCEVFWAGPDGVLPVLSNLLMPFDISAWCDGILVCDMQGIHFVTMDGLAATADQLIPWSALRARNGAFAQEACVAGDSLYVKYQYLPTLSEAFRHVHMAEFRLGNNS